MTASPSHVREKREEEETHDHAPEPWVQLGRFVRDANGRIVVRGKSALDARRVVACVNALAGVPTETIAQWSIQVAGGAGAGPDPALAEMPADAVEAVKEFVGSEDRRLGERRRGERRHAMAELATEGEAHER
jgi:hypothetical protein